MAAIATVARHDIGLALEQPFIVNRDLTITNKILQYMNAVRALRGSRGPVACALGISL